ncbi:MAG: AMP-binding protein [Paludibacteraceae bacterium]|nr:AMP-binding protein [Bacteroidaceae bacterium]MBR5677022.1 AMP-binding protein [Paludibacteraceae bacterium]
MEGIIQMLEVSLRRNWTLDALTDYKGTTLQYKDVARKIEKLHIMFEQIGIERGDKIALCGRNSSNWGVAFLATITYGAVAVPILHEFKPDNIHNIINHSDPKLVFVSDQIWEGLLPDAIPGVLGVVQINDFSILESRDERLDYARAHLNELFGQKYPSRFTPEDIHYPTPDEEDLAIINYTSGSTGFSKGVMIPYRALSSNVEFAYGVVLLNAGDKVVSMLPMAHMYGMAFEFLYEMTVGAHVFLLTRTPSPKIIFNAFNDVKPNIIVAVPLIIEKVIKKMVLPKLETLPMKMLLRMPIVNDAVRKNVRDQMMRSFGGEFYEVIIGGAAFNQEIDQFLHSIRFPYTVGYGATECAPIICYEDWKSTVPGSCGKPVINMEVRIDSPDPSQVVGEILCRGKNVMLGYYKNEELTRESIDADGWFHTGDLGIMDADGRLYIKGRSKNMLLSANGQNIYPEEIEDKLNNYPFVSESLVIDRNGKLVALVFPDFDQFTNTEYTEKDLPALMEENRKKLNDALPSYSQISEFVIQAEEFEKTPKKSIKRFLYN